MTPRTRSSSVGVLVAVAAASTAHARSWWPVEGMTYYANDFAGWQGAVGSITTLDFVGLTPGSVIDDEYADLGVLFTGPGSAIVHNFRSTFVQDGWGIDGNHNYVELTFAMPVHAFAFHGGGYMIQLYVGADLIAQTPTPLGPPGQKFGGVTSTTAFDRARVYIPGSIDVWLDNIYFAEVIPAPAAWLVLPALFAAATPRRRRS